MKAAPEVMVVEDEPKLAGRMLDYLHASDYRTRWISDGLAVDDALRQRQPDLILLDIMLPGRDGMAVCKDIRANSEVPIIMVTARVEEIDRLLGLDLGADDYICKPFSLREMIARVRTVLKRTRGATEDPSSALVIDADGYSASYHGVDLELTAVEFRLLKTLADKPGRVLSRDRLLDQLYNDHRIVSDRTVDTHIKKLRRKFEQVAATDDIIESVYGVGYKLVI